MADVRRWARLIASYSGPAAAVLGLLLAGPARARAPAATCPSERCVTLSLQLKARGERQPLSEATVIVIEAPPGAELGVLRPPPPLPPEGPPWQRLAQTDAQGRVELEDVPDTPVRIIVVAAGFERYEAVVRAGAKPQKLFIPTSDETDYRTVVENEVGPPRAAPQSALLTREEIRTLPGTQGDPLRALQNLPGVARTPGNLGLLILRGAAPAQSRVFMGGHALPRAFHVLSLSSVFPAEVLDELRLVPGNFDAAYGNATGGIVVIEPRAGRRDGIHGFSEIDIAAASTMLEGPVGKGSFIVGAQRGYADLAIAAADRVTERVTGESSSLLRPTYYDYQGLFDYPVRHGSVGVRVFGAGDRLRSAPSLDGGTGFDYRTSFHRIDAVARTRIDGWNFWWTPSFRFESGRLSFDVGQQQRRRDFVLSTRAEMSRRFSEHLQWLVGTDLEVDGFVATNERAPTLADIPTPATESVRGVESSLGFYTSAQLDWGRVHLTPATRASAFTSRSQSAFSIDPRLVGHVDIGERWTLDMGLGKYSQARDITQTETIDLVDQGSLVGNASVFLPPVFTRFDPEVGFAPGDRQLTVRQALHASLGGTVDLDETHSIAATGFVRAQDNATPTFFEGSVVDFATREHAVGLTALARRRVTKRLYGWVAYTLMWTQLRFTETAPNTSFRDRPTDFDQRHNFNVVASYILPKNWRIGGRFRVVTGFPFSPVIGSLNVQGARAPIQGRRNSGRLGTFHQLDLRVDKRWIRDRAIITGYVDVQNVYNRQNPEAVLYGADFREQEGVVGVPIFPSLGIRVDY